MKEIIKLTADHIHLLKNLKLSNLDAKSFGIDLFSPFGGDYVNQDMAILLGYGNRIIPETIGNAVGPVYDEETQGYLNKLAEDFDAHMADYFELMQQYCDKGGIKPGVYSRTTHKINWEYEGDLKDDDFAPKPMTVDGKWDALAGME